MSKRISLAPCLALLGILAAPASAEAPSALFSQGNEGSGWRFGIGTGLSSFSLDGELGVATSEGGVIGDIDLDNSDTRDLVESGFGLVGMAINGPWAILASIGTVTLEDSDRFLDAEWERSRMELLVGYRVLEWGSSQFSVVGGVRNIGHDWDIELRNPVPPDASVPDVDEDWTDMVVGAAHTMPIADRWLWSNRLDMGFGDTEESLSAATTVQWMPFANWAFNASIRFTKLEVGQASDIDDSDFYYYDVDEPFFGIGFLYLW
jgi:hypothetical protein